MSFNRPRSFPDQAASVASFPYAPAPGWIPPAPAIPSGMLNGARPGAEEAPGAGDSAGVEAVQRKVQEAWERGVREGQAQARREHEAALEELRTSVAAAILRFEQERSDYYRRVEREVVQLALAIVRKILRREAQIDPLLLTGMVRVALEKSAASQTVRLRAHPQQIAAWRDYFAQAHELAKPPELVGDASLACSQVQLESEMGVTDVNLDFQLKEIEQGLFDLIAQKPAQG
jgi:flagellar assembly protein FliH